MSTDPADTYATREQTSYLQKSRLCRFAIDHIENREALAARRPSFVLGPGSTMTLFFQEFVRRSVSNRPFAVVSNQFEILKAYLSSDAGLHNWDLFFYGERPDRHHRSLTPRDDEDLKLLLARAKTNFAVVSCKNISQCDDSIKIGAFGREHQKALEQITSECSGHIYIVADDTKRQNPCHDIFAEISSTASAADRFTLIVSADGSPGAYIGWEQIRSAVSKWIRKPQPRCFISFSDEDKKVARRIYEDLCADDVKCWKWDENGPIGLSTWKAILNAIDSHPPLVVVCSKSALRNEAVCKEIDYAFANPADNVTPAIVAVVIDDCLQTGVRQTNRFKKARSQLTNSICIRKFDVGYEDAIESLYDTLDRRSGKEAP